MSGPRGKGRRDPDTTPTVPMSRCPVCGRLVEMSINGEPAAPGAAITCPFCKAALEVTADGQGLIVRRNGGPP